MITLRGGKDFITAQTKRRRDVCGAPNTQKPRNALRWHGVGSLRKPLPPCQGQWEEENIWKRPSYLGDRPPRWSFLEL